MRMKSNKRNKKDKQFLIKGKGRPIKYIACFTSAIRRVHEALVDGCEYVELIDRESRSVICYDKAASSVYSKVLDGSILP